MLRVRTGSIMLIAVAMAHLLVSIYQHPSTSYDNATSRWITARAIVENHSYEIGKRTSAPGGFIDSGLMTEPGWDTIDKVYNAKTHVFVSDKPPTLPTVVAAFYWGLTKLGLSFAKDRMLVVRLLVLALNGPAMLLYFVILGRLLTASSGTVSAKLYVLIAGLFATFTTTFATTITNHVHGAVAVMCVAYLFKRVWEATGPRPRDLMLLGAALGWLLCNELPAVGLIVVIAAVLAVRRPRAAILYCLPVFLLYVGFYALVGQLAFGAVVPWYGGVGNGQWTVAHYAGSYWKAPAGYDNLDPPFPIYAFNYLIGHHGLFLLAPIFLFSMVGLGTRGRWRAAVICALAIVAAVALRAYAGLSWKLSILPAFAAALWALVTPWGWWRRADDATWDDVLPRVTLSCTTVVLCFWLIIWRNYGGSTAAPRHLIWLTPLWLACMLPVVSRLLRTRAGQSTCAAALCVSVFSSVAPGNIPFQDPWTVKLFGYDADVERFARLFRNGGKGIDVKPGDNPRYGTQVGKKNPTTGEIVSTGKSGYLQTGPGITLPEGQYRIEWHGVVEKMGPDARVDVDVVAAGRPPLAWRSVAVEPANSDHERVLASLDLSLEKTTRDVDYRLYVPDDFKVRLQRITVRRIGDASRALQMVVQLSSRDLASTGLYAPEMAGDKEWRWTNGHGRITVQTPPLSRWDRCAVRVLAKSHLPYSVRWNDTPLPAAGDEYVIGPELRRGENRTHTVEIASETFVPAATGSSQDDRVLGVMLTAIAIDCS